MMIMMKLEYGKLYVLGAGFSGVFYILNERQKGLKMALNMVF